MKLIRSLILAAVTITAAFAIAAPAKADHNHYNQDGVNAGIQWQLNGQVRINGNGFLADMFRDTFTPHYVVVPMPVPVYKQPTCCAPPAPPPQQQPCNVTPTVCYAPPAPQPCCQQDWNHSGFGGNYGGGYNPPQQQNPPVAQNQCPPSIFDSRYYVQGQRINVTTFYGHVDRVCPAQHSTVNGHRVQVNAVDDQGRGWTNCAWSGRNVDPFTCWDTIEY